MNYTMIVYRYPVRGDVPPEMVTEMRRGHDLYNQLVALKRRHDDDVARIWGDHPDVADTEKVLAEAEARVQDLNAEARRERQRAKARRVSRETAASLREARRERREATDAVKAAKDAAYPVCEPKFVAAQQDYQAAVKTTYPEAVGGGLYWATYNDVLDQFRRATNAVRKRRQQRLPADLRFRRWHGSATIAVQLQRRSFDPPRSPERLASGEGKWRNMCQLTPWWTPDQWAAMSRPERHRAAWDGQLTVRIGSGPSKQLVTLPVIIHRPLPPDADVTGVRITREEVAGRHETHVSVAARIPAPTPRTEGPAVAMHVGWRALDDGALRVGVCTGAGTPPDALLDVVRDHGNWCEVVIPASWRVVWQRPSDVRSRRDQSVETIKSWLVDWLETHPGAAADIVTAEDVRRWRSPRRFAALASRLRDDPSTGELAEPARRLEAWRHQDKHLWEWETHERRQIVARRTDAWRRVAAWLTTSAGLVVVDDWKIDTRAPDVTADDDQQMRAARANRMLASPGSLRETVARAAAARGVQVERPDTALSATHHRCGSRLDPAARMAAVMVWCPSCEVMVDQDYNAVVGLLAHARGESTP